MHDARVAWTQVLADMELADGVDMSSARSGGRHSSSSEDGSPLPPSPLTTCRDAAAFAALYELIEVLGQGAFGRAMKARRLADGRICCIKVMQFGALSPKDRSQAAKEATLLSSLHHPNIVQYCDAFYGPNNALYLVMEFCGEGDLAHHLQRRQGRLMEEEDIMRMFVQISIGLHHVHKQGIMYVLSRMLFFGRTTDPQAPGPQVEQHLHHRKQRAQDRYEFVAILISVLSSIQTFTSRPGDFGISKVMMGETACAHSIVGTPSYLPPEVCQDKPYNKKVDVWALGCVLYEMCMLKHAFRGSSVAAITIRILRHGPPPPRTCQNTPLSIHLHSGKYSPISDRYSPELRALLASLLQRSPHQRPSMSELLRQPFVLRHMQRYHDDVHRGVVQEPVQQAWLEDSVAIVERLGQGQVPWACCATLHVHVIYRALGTVRAAWQAWTPTSWKGASGAQAAGYDLEIKGIRQCGMTDIGPTLFDTIFNAQPARSASMAVKLPLLPVASGMQPRALSVQTGPLLDAWGPSTDQQGMAEPGSPTRKRPRGMDAMHGERYPVAQWRPTSAGPCAAVPQPLLEASVLSPMLSMPMGIEADPGHGTATTRGRW